MRGGEIVWWGSRMNSMFIQCISKGRRMVNGTCRKGSGFSGESQWKFSSAFLSVKQEAESHSQSGEQ